MKRTLTFLVILVTMIFNFSLSAPVSAQTSLDFGVRPENRDEPRSFFVYEQEAGAVVNDAVTITNDRDNAINLLVYAADAQTGSNGGLTFLDNLEAPTQTGRWLEVAQTRITLSPNSSTDVPFTLTIPPSTQAGEYLAGIVVQEDLAAVTQVNGQVGVSFVPRAAVTVQTKVGNNLVADLAIEQLTSAFQDAKQSITANLTNRGSLGVRSSGLLTIASLGGVVERSFPVELGFFIAGDTLSYDMNVVPALPAGQYQTTLQLDYGDGQQAILSTPILLLNPNTQDVVDSSGTVTVIKSPDTDPENAAFTPESQLPSPVVIKPVLTEAESRDDSGLVVLLVLGGGAVLIGLAILAFIFILRHRNRSDKHDCLVCGHEISQQRLVSLPHAKLCLTCHEQG